MQHDTHFLCFTRKIDSKKWGKKSLEKKVQKNGLDLSKWSSNTRYNLVVIDFRNLTWTEIL